MNNEESDSKERYKKILKEKLEKQLKNASDNPSSVYKAFICEYVNLDDKYHLNLLQFDNRSDMDTFENSLRQTIFENMLTSGYSIDYPDIVSRIHKIALIKGKRAMELADYIEGRKISDGLENLPGCFIQLID